MNWPTSSRCRPIRNFCNWKVERRALSPPKGTRRAESPPLHRNDGERRMAKLKEARDPKALERDWENNPRWDGITREYTAEDVLRLRGSIDIRYTLAEMGAERL